MDIKVLKVYLRVCKATKQKPTLKELNQFDKEIQENPTKLKTFYKRLEQIGY